MTGKNALKACPFCGGAAEPEHLESGRWSVGCHDEGCIAYMSLLTFSRCAEAITAWNTRASGWEDAKREAFEEAAKVAERVSEQAGSYRQDSCLEELGDGIASQIRELAKSLPSLPGEGM